MKLKITRELEKRGYIRVNNKTGTVVAQPIIKDHLLPIINSEQLSLKSFDEELARRNLGNGRGNAGGMGGASRYRYAIDEESDGTLEGDLAKLNEMNLILGKPEQTPEQAVAEFKTLNKVVMILTNPRNVLDTLQSEVDAARMEELESRLKGISIKLGKAEEKVAHAVETAITGKDAIDEMILATIRKQQKQNLTTVEKLREEKAALEVQVAVAKEKAIELDQAKAGIDELVKLGGKVGKAIKAMSPQHKRDFLFSIFDARQIEVFEAPEADKDLGDMFRLRGQGEFNFKKAAEFLKPVMQSFKRL